MNSRNILKPLSDKYHFSMMFPLYKHECKISVDNKAEDNFSVYQVTVDFTDILSGFPSLFLLKKCFQKVADASASGKGIITGKKLLMNYFNLPYI